MRLRAEVERLTTQLRALETAAAGSTAGGAGAAANGGAARAACAAGGAPPASYVSPHGLTKAQAERYSRQLLLSAFGPARQAALCAGSALIVGCGGLGAPAALYLAAAGVGRLGLVDQDAVDASNLHRQVIHTEAAAAAGTHKAASAAAAVAALNSGVALDTHLAGVTRDNAVSLVSAYDVILDCSDNAPTRYLISDAAAAAGRPLVSAAAVGTDGQLTVYCHGDDGPCYRCACVCRTPRCSAPCVGGTRLPTRVGGALLGARVGAVHGAPRTGGSRGAASAALGRPHLADCTLGQAHAARLLGRLCNPHWATPPLLRPPPMQVPLPHGPRARQLPAVRRRGRARPRARRDGSPAGAGGGQDPVRIWVCPVAHAAAV